MFEIMYSTAEVGEQVSQWLERCSGGGDGEMSVRSCFLEFHQPITTCQRTGTKTSPSSIRERCGARWRDTCCCCRLVLVFSERFEGVRMWLYGACCALHRVFICVCVMCTARLRLSPFVFSCHYLRLDFYTGRRSCYFLVGSPRRCRFACVVSWPAVLHISTFAAKAVPERYLGISKCSEPDPHHPGAVVAVHMGEPLIDVFRQAANPCASAVVRVPCTPSDFGVKLFYLTVGGGSDRILRFSQRCSGFRMVAKHLQCARDGWVASVSCNVRIAGITVSYATNTPILLLEGFPELAVTSNDVSGTGRVRCVWATADLALVRV